MNTTRGLRKQPKTTRSTRPAYLLLGMAINHEDITKTDAKVFKVILDGLDRGCDYCIYSVEAIARRSGCDERAVQKGINRLVTAGLLKKTERTLPRSQRGEGQHRNLSNELRPAWELVEKTSSGSTLPAAANSNTPDCERTQRDMAA